MVEESGMYDKDSYEIARRKLIRSIEELGYPRELGVLVAKNLGSEKAIARMESYVRNVKPQKEELIVDEMLAIMDEIRAWKQKKASLEANEAYNAYLDSDLRDTEE